MRALALLLVLFPSTASATVPELGSPTDGGGLEEPEVGSPEQRDQPAPIINGVAATEADWPQAGAMMMDATMSFGGHVMDFRMLVCSSTLIAPDVVMLAAHCVDPDSFTYGYGTLSDMEIRWSRQADLGAYTGESIPEWPEDAVVAWDWVHHPEWDLWGLDTGVGNSKDIALLFLDTPVLDTPHAYLPSAEEVAWIVEGVEVEVVGWGQQTSDYQPPAGTYGYKQMGVSFISELGTHEFQVGLEPDDVRKCHGDSGGPSFLTIETETLDPVRVIGVTSHAYDNSDCRRTGGVDTRVDAYLDWIDQEMRARCADGTRAWCEVEGIVAAPLPEPIDTGDTGDTGEGGGGGGGDGKGTCGCTAGQAAPATALGLLGLLGLAVRRRRS
jgi:MYXO-CTERM domain-containing protein